MRALYLLLPVFIGICACREKSGTSSTPAPSAARSIEGQVFVIHDDGTNQPLGDVQVHWISESTIHAKLRWLAEQSENVDYLMAYDARLSAIDSWLGRARGESRTAELLERFFAQADRERTELRSRFEENLEIEDLLVDARVAQARQDLFVPRQFDPRDQWLLVHLFFHETESISGKHCPTDAGGRFRLQIPEGVDGYLLASAEHPAIDGFLYWLRPLPDQDTAPMMMSSRSCLDSSQFAELLFPLSPDERTSVDAIRDRFNLGSLAPFEQCQTDFQQILRNLDEHQALQTRSRQLKEEINRLRVETVSPTH